MKMMNVVSITIATLLFSGCGALIAVSNLPEPPKPKTVQPPARNDNDNDTKVEAYDFTKGGQPNGVHIYGAPVKNVDGKPVLNEVISTTLTAGVGKDGIRPQVEHPTDISDKTNPDSLFVAPTKQDAIIVGCDEKFKTEYLAKNKLQLTEPTKNKKDMTYQFNANTVILCGKVDMDYQFVAVNSDKLILMDVDYSHSGLFLVTRFSTNSLVIRGKNKITMNNADGDTIMPAIGQFVLEVNKTFTAAPGAKLDIFAAGGSYVAK